MFTSKIAHFAMIIAALCLLEVGVGKYMTSQICLKTAAHFSLMCILELLGITQYLVPVTKYVKQDFVDNMIERRPNSGTFMTFIDLIDLQKLLLIVIC